MSWRTNKELKRDGNASCGFRHNASFGDQGGDFIGYRRSVGGSRTARHAKTNWWAPACGALLLSSVIVAVIIKQIASAENEARVATSVVDNKKKQGERGLAPSFDGQTSKPEADAIVRQPGAKKLGTDITAPSPEEQSQPDTVAPPSEAPSKPETDAIVRQPGTKKPETDMTAPSPKEQSQPDTLAPPSEAQTSKPETDAIVRQPGTKNPGTDITAPSPEGQSQPDTLAPPSETQTLKSETEAVGRRPDTEISSRNAAGLPVPQLVLPADVAKKVGHNIWLNETNGNRDAITSWNANEEFASLGIGHFIWFPAGKMAPFEEDFPSVLEFLRKEGAHLPSWLDKMPIPPCPWTTRTDFMKSFNSLEMKQLRQFLLDTVAGQTQFLVARAQGALDKILENTPAKAEREHIVTQFSRITGASADWYPVIDYINFKGEGINPAETALNKQTGQRQGWGLKQVLLTMIGTTSDRKAVLAEFADAAQFVLQQRIRNIPADRISRAGWLRRVETYRRPVADLESNPKRAGNQSLRAKGAEAR
jgi:hypothetical protein